MATRLELQTLLEAVPGVKKVYFQPPASVSMEYPAIVYSRDNVDTKYADNSPYSQRKRYQVMVIERDPDSLIPDLVAQLPLCRFSRSYTASNLHHDVYTLYF